MWLFLVFVAVPIIEIALFIQIGGAIGLWTTLLIVILTALVGTTLVRHQGVQTLARLQDNLSRGRDPSSPIAHGALILIAGVLLLTPGFFTDAVGLACLVPQIRSQLISRIASRIRMHNVNVSHGPGHPKQNRSGPDIIETDYDIVDDAPDDGPHGKSGWTRGPKS